MREKTEVLVHECRLYDIDCDLVDEALGENELLSIRAVSQSQYRYRSMFTLSIYGRLGRGERISFVGAISTRYSVDVSQQGQRPQHRAGITCTNDSSHADGQKLFRSQLAGLRSHRIRTKANVNKISSKCQVPGLR